MIDDYTLIKNIKENACSDSFNELKSRHTPICFKIYHKYIPAIKNNGIIVEDVLQDKDSIILEAVKTFKLEKNCKFSTWLANRVRYQCLNILNKNSKKRSIALDTKELNLLIEHNAAASADSFSKPEFKDYLFNILGQLKDKRVKEIFRLRYFESDKKESWSKIGRKMKVSAQTAINLHNEGRKILLQKLASSTHLDKI